MHYRMPSDGHGYERQRGQEITLPATRAPLLLVLITKQKRLRVDGRRVVSAEAVVDATQQRAAAESG